jgi:hypothetical protein
MIEPLWAVYHLGHERSLTMCPAGQCPPFARVVRMGTEIECTRWLNMQSGDPLARAVRQLEGAASADDASAAALEKVMGEDYLDRRDARRVEQGAKPK